MAGCIVGCFAVLGKKASYYFCFSKAALFMQGLSFSHGFVQLAFLSVMISFIEDIIFGEDILWYNAVVSTVAEGSLAILTSLMSYDQYGGMFPKISILITQGIFLTGLMILWLTPSPSTRTIYLVLSLVAVGQARARYITSFLKCQIKLEHDIDDEEKLEARTKFWTAIGRISGFSTATGISSRPWKLKFMIPAVAMGIGCLSFCFRLVYYKSERQTTDSVSVVSEDNQSRKSSQRWKHLKLLPLWMSFLPYFVVQTAGTTFFLAQADILGKSIKFLSPETSMIFVQFFSRYLISGLLRPILKCFRDEKYKLCAALNLGMVFNFFCCIASWHVEAHRLHMFKKSESNMNLIFWLVPQFFLLGCTIGLVGEGLENLFNDLVPESEEQLGFAFNRFVEGMGKFISVGFVLAFRNWIGDTINTSRLDNYYGTLAFLTLWASFFFTYLSNTYDWNIDLEMSEDGDAAAPDDLSADVLPVGNDQNLISVKVYS